MSESLLKELSYNLYEGLEGKIESIEYPEEHKAEIRFSFLDWKVNNVTRNFIITCDNIGDISLSASSSYEICYVKDHILLWEYNLPHFELFYSSSPVDAYEVLGRLWEAHETLLRPYGCRYESINPVNFVKQNHDGYGLLARGPEPLIDGYKRSIEGLLETKKVFSYVPRAAHVGLLFDCGYVIAQSIEVEEI